MVTGHSDPGNPFEIQRRLESWPDEGVDLSGEGRCVVTTFLRPVYAKDHPMIESKLLTADELENLGVLFVAGLSEMSDVGALLGHIAAMRGRVEKCERYGVVLNGVELAVYAFGHILKRDDVLAAIGAAE